jgi:phenylacetic acid degradation operon negative regulatory protein
MTQPLRTRIETFKQQRRLHANSLIVSLFGDMIVPRGGRIWLGSLIRLLEPLGLNERLVRTSVFRLAKDEWLRTEALGRRSDYLLTPSGQRRFDEAARHIYASHAPLWDRRWRLILGVGQCVQKDRDALRRALFWQGFGALGTDCFVHPGADLSLAFDALVAEGLGHLLGGLMPMLAADSHLGQTASSADLVALAWNLSELAESYRQFVETYLPSLAQLRRDRDAVVDDEDACLMRLLLIHDYRRLLLRDPELPDVLVPPGWPGQTARVLCKELYRRLLLPSERHLDHYFAVADGSCPPFNTRFHERFPEDDPLAAIAS